jgi:hypothetical protein
MWETIGDGFSPGRSPTSQAKVIIMNYYIFSSVADPDPSDPGMFLGLLDPAPDPLVRGGSASKNSKKNLDSYCIVTCFYFLSLRKDVL